MEPRALMIVLSATALLFSTLAHDSAAEANGSLVRIDSGDLAGVTAGEVVAFKGIPFAAPPVGELRWRPPQRVPAWNGVRKADRYGAVCQQKVNSDDNGLGSQQASEDCLTLNVWTGAKRDSKRPVMFWIHGGGYVTGSGTAALYDGTNLAQQGVVVVTINYRLGRFGFFAHPALSRENPAGPLGNYGLMDQIAALEWVARNIAAFGGDPANVTIFGESAGGAAVNRLMISPAARGLFHKAISQSGLGRERSPHLRKRGANGMPSAEEQGTTFIATLGVAATDAAALRAIPADRILTGGDPNPMTSGPIIDGQLVQHDVDDAFRRGLQARVPYLVGSNALELPGVTPAAPWVFGDAFKLSSSERAALTEAYGSEDNFNLNVISDVFFTEPARALARLHSRSGAPAYLYRFSILADSVRGKFAGAPHASDRQYVFRTLQASKWPTGPRDERLAQQMSAAWVAFARTGNPEVPRQVRWPGFVEGVEKLLNFTNDGPVAQKVPGAAVLDAIARLYIDAAPARSTASTDLSPDERARRVEAQMTDEERFSLLHGPMALDIGIGKQPLKLPDDAIMAAGYVPGVPRLGIPPLRQTDASLGITNPLSVRPGDTATALPAGLALAATFDTVLAREVGVMLGREARAKGFNVLLGGGMNLVRDPRNGRNFEYLSEDPWLTGVMAGEVVAGTQSQAVISTIKHFSLNANETNRQTLDARIEAAAHRESDLLAFQIAIERGQPGAVMCAYNLVDGAYACGNDQLLNGVLKGAWRYPGWVMSDWGAVKSWDFALHGLDQQCGEQLDEQVWFDAPLRTALTEGKLSRERLSDMVRRILRSMYAVGVDAHHAPVTIDPQRHHGTALDVARRGIVLLKNEDSILPLREGVKRIAVIGGHADVGVLSGGGSSQVTPVGGYAAVIPIGGEGVMGLWRREHYFPSSPLAEIKKLLPDATVRFEPGVYTENAAAAAKAADLAIVFVTRHELEGYDVPHLSLPGGQDALVAAVAAANPNTVVVLQTGNPVAMPWRESVKGILAAWYPGQAGGQAIAEILTGRVNPSGRLPISFPADTSQLVRPELPGLGAEPHAPVRVDYTEGSRVGYRWYSAKAVAPAYPFGHGLHYSQFSYSNLKVSGGSTITATFTVRNVGTRAGADVPQLYLTNIPGGGELRLIGFERVELQPNESRSIKLVADPRLLARFDVGAGHWSIAGGDYEVAVARSASEPVIRQRVSLQGRRFGK